MTHRLVITICTLAVFITLSLTGGLVRAQATASRPQSADEVWEVNARQLPRQAVRGAAGQMQYRRVSENLWVPASYAQFQQSVSRTAPLKRTVFYVHGNWTDAEECRQRGWLLFQKIKSVTRDPIRLVLFSWDADRDSGFARDVRAKHERLDTDAYYLASVLREFPQQIPISMIGFSFGTAVIGGALQLDSGGGLEGLSMHGAGSARDIRVSFLAAAFDRSDWSPNGDFAAAYRRVKSIVNVYNSSDPALKRFRMIDRFGSPEAAGFAGLSPPVIRGAAAVLVGAQPGARSKIQQYDAAKYVGRTHSELAYLNQCPYLSVAINNLLGISSNSHPSIALR